MLTVYEQGVDPEPHVDGVHQTPAADDNYRSEVVACCVQGWVSGGVPSGDNLWLSEVAASGVLYWLSEEVIHIDHLSWHLVFYSVWDGGT